MINFIYNYIYNIIMELSFYLTEIREGVMKKKKQLFTWEQLERELDYIGSFNPKSFVVVDFLNTYTIINNFKKPNVSVGLVKEKMLKFFSSENAIKLINNNEPYLLDYSVKLRRVNEWI